MATLTRRGAIIAALLSGTVATAQRGPALPPDALISVDLPDDLDRIAVRGAIVPCDHASDPGVCAESGKPAKVRYALAVHNGNRVVRLTTAQIMDALEGR